MKSANDYRACRRKIVGWDVNPPDPFPGFGGTVGLGQDCAELDNGDWLLVFHAGYWHISLATPYVVHEDILAAWAKGGMPMDIDAPQGGRVMAVRSKDGGLTWSKPETILNGRWDEGPQGIRKLSDGTLLLGVGNHASWYGQEKETAPAGHLPMNTRTGMMRSEDNGYSWSGPVWLEDAYPLYTRAYAQAVELPDGGILYPTYGLKEHEGQRNAAIHRSDDGGKTWRIISTIQRENGKYTNEPSIVLLADRRLMLIARPDAAILYSEDQGRNWRFSHCAPFAPLRPSRLAVLKDGTVVCWMTSHGVLRASWSTDGGQTWRLAADGTAFALDPEHYGYPGGFVMSDESVFVVYYDAANQQRRTGVWAIRFKIDHSREQIEILPAPGADRDTARVSETDAKEEKDMLSVEACDGE